MANTAAPRRRARAGWTFLFGAGASLLALFATGCPEPADLQNPEMYPAPTPTSTGGMSGGGMSMGDMCETPCVKNLFQVQVTGCKLCHGVALKSSGLDLESPGFTQRLKDVPAKHMDIEPPPTPGDCPTGDMLIDVANPSASWLLAKIKGTQKTCGTQMPSTPLNATDMACVETYINCVAGKPGGGGGGAGGTSAGGTGGSAAGSGGAAAGTTGSGGTGGA